MSPAEFHEIYAIMEASFPEDEFRTFEGQRSLLRNPNYRLITEKDAAGVIQAFLAAWEFPLFRFVEHIAVSPRMRGGGLGRKLMERHLASSDKPVVLEVEPPMDELQKRRIGFYERLGFCLQTYEYRQPPLRPGQTGLPLQLMAYPRPVSEEEFRRIRDILYTEVYGQPPQSNA
ncbi:GNAT family N-acetyltransferase ['Paenibacillus yunnanensis' Narsing Rao et al. 2020]|uniref:GNAT family N-acetyltransferase n=1 Tax=Paenibacillus tengchongensis TaxID=2608684 RepID=UPI00124F6DF1|nr:GNAT family N-acetyltransferase [Paenibacillus tengchongensis]